MTVKELIEELKKLDQDAEVFYWAHGSRRDVDEASDEGVGEVWLISK